MANLRDDYGSLVYGDSNVIMQLFYIMEGKNIIDILLPICKEHAENWLKREQIQVLTRWSTHSLTQE